MRSLPFIILIGLIYTHFAGPGHPHGEGFKISCSKCHSSKGWQLDKEIYSFDHNTTKLPLKGQHTVVDCRKCHTTLVFSAAKSNCIDCHKDVHQTSVGFDCSRCHTPASWLVNNITEIHQRSRFPLLGAHRTADCIACHKSESLARFDVLGVNCIDCHSTEYQSTTNPNHISAGFSQDCSTCHLVNSFEWTGAGFNHNFFPLTLGHASVNCVDCHIGGNYTNTSKECYSCHQADYNNATNPNHKTLAFSTICTLCHNTNPGWAPASYTQHDSQSFPIYTGRHRGTWTTCTQCHPNASNYADFTCLSCHEHNKTSMDNKHQGESGYSYTSPACLNCHPTGNGDKK